MIAKKFDKLLFWKIDKIVSFDGSPKPAPQQPILAMPLYCTFYKSQIQVLLDCDNM